MSERFAADWLSLREPADHAARPQALTQSLARRFASAGRLRVLDLGAGTGSNLRYLAPRLPCAQRWTLVDHDRALLARAVEACESASRGGWPLLELETTVLGLAALSARDLTGFELVTASALLDLVTTDWLRRTVEQCRRARATVLFALSYDGSARWDPAEPEDDIVRAAVNAHQRRDKGLGPALGPAAGSTVAELLTAAGYRVSVEPSPWRLGPADAALQEQLIAGWAIAAAEQDPSLAAPVRRWTARRRAHLAAGRSRLRLGHVDVLAEPVG
jgi:SAM-dependent methyltransferase